MVSNQLVEYIKAQLELGATKEEIRTALVNSGWPGEDVDDSFKSFQSAPVVRVDIPAAKSAASATVSVRDLALSSDLEVAPVIAKKEVRPEKKSAADKPKEEKSAPHSPLLIATIILAAVSVLCAGLAGLFYWQKGGSDKQVEALGISADSFSGKIAALNGQVADITKARDDLQAKADKLAGTMSELTKTNEELAQELSFFIPAGASASGTVAVNAAGILSGGGKSPYLVTLTNGITLIVKNSKDAKIDAALKPLLGQSVQIEGTRPAGSRDVTVTKANGIAIQ